MATYAQSQQVQAEANKAAGEMVAGAVWGAGKTAVDAVISTAGLAWEGTKAVADMPAAFTNMATRQVGIETFPGAEERYWDREEAIGNFVSSIPDMPGKITDSAKEGWADFKDDLANGRNFEAGETIGTVGLEVATVAVPAAKLGSVSKVSKVDDVARVTAVDRQLDQMYSAAPAAKMEIDELAGAIALKHEGRVAEAPLKSRERATEKATIDYEGNANRINDLARNTIVVSKDKIDSVTAELKERGARVKQISPDSNPAGYSGINAVIETKAGIKAEIQVNTPEMIYAKEPETVARGILGDDVYDGIAERTGIPGGRGHTLYEERRVLDETDADKAREIESESREYYKNFQ
ncbi:MAG: hypothetical protein ACRBM6_04090 [Geminicoccales bacterium]